MLLLIPFFSIAQESPVLDSTGQLLMQEVKSLASRNSGKAIANLFKDNFKYVRYNYAFYHKAANYLLQHGKPEVISDAFAYNPFLMSQHNELALYFYFLGVSQMLDKRGWPSFKQAERSLNRSASEMQKSFMPDYGFYSDIENARGYLSVTARGLSTDQEKNYVCIIRHEFINMAIYHFRDALMYNPDNELAQQNLDTLEAKLRMLGLPLPPERYVEKKMTGMLVHWDSLNIDSLHNTSELPLLDYNLLPNNYQLILSELSQYDEIILCLDLSGSMVDAVGWGPEISKFQVAQQLSLFITLQLQKSAFLGALSVGLKCDQDAALNYPIASASRYELMTKINAVRPYGYTPLNQRLRMTKDMFSQTQNRKLVFLISDGMDTCDELPELCGTAAMLAANGIDLSVFSFINETLDEEARTAYAVYNCMTTASDGKVYQVTELGGVKEDLDIELISNNILELPLLDTSILWQNNQFLFQFPIEGVVPPVTQIIRFE